MGLISTPFIKYNQIRTEKIDLFEDAFGFYAGFSDVIDLLRATRPEADNEITARLLKRVRKEM
jgi:hypothetical protein